VSRRAIGQSIGSERGDRYLEGLLLGRAHGQLADVAAFECDPRRILRLGAERVDVEARFPRARVRPGGPVGAWAGWPDLVWTELLFGAVADPYRLAAEVWLAMPIGATLAAIEIDEVVDTSTRRWLRGRGVEPGPAGARAVSERFRVRHESRIPSPCGLCVARVLVAEK
jgi:hypothetical protein